MSNPLVDVPTERMHQHELGFALGLYDDSQSPQVELLRKRCDDAFVDESATESDKSTACKGILNYIADIPGDVNQMDSRYFDADNMPADTFQDLFKYSDRVDEIKESLHVTKSQHFSKTNSTVANVLTDKDEDASHIFSELLSRGLHILINVG